MQDDTSNVTSVSRHPFCPASCAFEEVESSESKSALRHELASLDALRFEANIKGVSSFQKIGSLASQKYGSALGTSLSGSAATHDPEVVARVHSPHVPHVGGGKLSSLDKRSANVPKSFDDASPDIGESADLVAALSGMNLVAALSGMSLSVDNTVDEGNHRGSQIHPRIDAHENPFHLHNARIQSNHNSNLN
ncbi:pumilio-like protein 2-like [Forsythia ovata]|uniref:Pumilio-like protein 2-like n=1 Tax=Forsythia ovata TaxID=205694 RepID=A0ABD1WJJ2_9LAMI